MTVQNQEKTQKTDTRWKKGQSGNPKGRQPGSGRFRALLDPHAPEVIETVIKAAKGGDMTACRIVLERLLPALRAESLPVNLPEMANASGISEKGAAVLNAAACGQITPDSASDLLSAIGQLARIKEIDELEHRIEALEAGQINKERINHDV